MTEAPVILIDGAHLFNKTGTGFASYARTLINTLTSAGLSVGVLYGRPMTGQKHSTPLSLSTQLIGNAPKSGILDKLLRGASLAFSAHAPFGGIVRPREISLAGVDLATIEPPLPRVDGVYNANRLYERAEYFHHIKGRLAEVRLDRSVKFAHWTSPLAVKAKGCPNIYTIHDLIPLQLPHFVFDRGGRSARLHERIAREADLIVTVSEASKQAIVDLLKVSADRVCVTYQPTPPLPKLFSREDAERLIATVYGVKAGEYALFLGAIEPKKNLKRLIEAFIIANPGIPLVIAGPLGWMYESDLELIATISKSSNSNLIRRLGFLPRPHVTALLQCARFMAFPSISEGFGLPVLEAMQMGVPVLTSNLSSLPEVAGDAAVLVDPLDVSAISRGIRQLANDQDLRQELIVRGQLQAKKFGQDAYVERLSEAYARVGVRLPSSPELRPDASGGNEHTENTLNL